MQICRSFCPRVFHICQASDILFMKPNQYAKVSPQLASAIIRKYGDAIPCKTLPNPGWEKWFMTSNKANFSIVNLGGQYEIWTSTLGVTG